MSKPIACILAIDDNFSIAYVDSTTLKSQIPWNFKEDIEYFRKITTHTENTEKMNAVVMGRKTWEMIPVKYRPLKNRINVVISSTLVDEKDSGFSIFANSELAIKYLNKLDVVETIFICGGVELYNEYISKSCYVYLTKIDYNFKANLRVNIDLSNYDLVSKSVVNGKHGCFRDEASKTSVEITSSKDEVSFNELGICNISFNKYKRKSVNREEEQYLNILRNILTTGHYRQTRNAKTYSIFGANMEFDLTKGFPLLTTKNVFFRGIFEELKFFLQGKTDSKILEEKGINIWKPNTTREFLDSVELSHYKEGDMGSVYGFQWRYFNAKYEGCDHDYTGQGIDQFIEVLRLLKTDKYSRRIIMTTYNPSQAKQGVLYPCHGIVTQFVVSGENMLCCSTYIRSNDFILGNPFNIASYALLVHIVCELVNNDPSYEGVKLIPYKLIINIGDVHVYETHVNVAKEQLLRIPYEFPTLKFNKKITNIDDLNFEDITIENYKYYARLKADMIA